MIKLDFYAKRHFIKVYIFLCERYVFYFKSRHKKKSTHGVRNFVWKVHLSKARLLQSIFGHNWKNQFGMIYVIRKKKLRHKWYKNNYLRFLFCKKKEEKCALAKREYFMKKQNIDIPSLAKKDLTFLNKTSCLWKK